MIFGVINVVISWWNSFTRKLLCNDAGTYSVAANSLTIIVFFLARRLVHRNRGRQSQSKLAFGRDN